MRSWLHRVWLLGLLLVSPLLVALNGCGEKIAIPEPEGLFGISEYRLWATFNAHDPVVQIAVSQGRLFTLTADSLARRNLNFVVRDSIGGLGDARALCVEENFNLVFVWEAGLKQVSWFSGTDLIFRGSTSLPNVDTVVAMEVNTAGIDQVPGAVTFLYLSDPVSDVVHRYAFDVFNGLTSNGILTRSDGDATKFVHIPSGMATDIDNRLLVCDVDTSRNWVIRFDSTPDETDIASDPADEDPQRGTTVAFKNSVCLEAPASDFVLGNAATCGDTEWEGAPSSAEGEFHRPSHVTVDGSGLIYVADTSNDRVQIFFPQGELYLQLGGPEDSPGVSSIAIHDDYISAGGGVVQYGAFVFALISGENQVRKFISSEHKASLNEDSQEEDQQGG